MTILLRYGLVVSLFWKPVRDVLQRWRICLASLVFFTIFLTNNFGLSTGGYHQRTTSIGPVPTGHAPTGSDPDHNSKTNTRNHEYQLSNYLSSKHSRTSSVNEGAVSDSYLSHHDRQYLGDSENGIRHAPTVERRSHHGRESNVPQVSPPHSSSSATSQHYQRSSDMMLSSSASMSPFSGSAVHNAMDVNLGGDVSSVKSSSEHNPTSSMISHEYNSAGGAHTGSNIKSPQSSSVLQHQPSAFVSRDPSMSSARFSTATNGVSSTKHTQSDTKNLFTKGGEATEQVKTQRNDVKLKNVTTLSATQSEKSSHVNSTGRFYHETGASEMAGKIAPSTSTSNPQPRRRNVASVSRTTKEPANMSTVSSCQHPLMPNASTNHNNKPETCLADLALEVCSRPADWDALCQRTQQLRQHELNFCKSFQLYHTIPHDTQQGHNCHLETVSKEACLREIGAVTARDRQARDTFNNFRTIFSKFDCEDLRAAEMWTCKDCEEAYRNWVCSEMIPYYRRSHQVEPCGTYCEEVEKKCPYFKPHFLDTYAGEPTFFCTDKYTRNENTPQTRPCHRIPPESNLSSVKEPEIIPDTADSTTAPTEQQSYSSTTDMNGTASQPSRASGFRGSPLLLALALCLRGVLNALFWFSTVT